MPSLNFGKIFRHLRFMLLKLLISGQTNAQEYGKFDVVHNFYEECKDEYLEASQSSFP